jgi:hypothetical protein
VPQRNGTTSTWALPAVAGATDPSPDVLHLLVHGDPLRAPEQVAASALLGLWNAGRSWDQAVQVVADCPGLAADVRKASRGLSWVWRVQRWCAQVATDAPDGDRANAVRADLAEALPRIQARRWPRQSGHTVGATSVTDVLLAVVTLAGRAGRTTGLHLSVRTVAEAAGVSVGTAQSALRYLRASLVLVRQDRANVRGGKVRAATYSVHVDRHTVPDDQPDADHPGVQPAAVALLSHDCWRWGGLGGSAGQVWTLLDDRVPLTAEQVAALRGRSVTWTRELLRRLALHGLAVRTGDTWTRCTVAEAPRRLDVAARHVGTAGRGEAVRVKHAQQRADWSEQRTQWLAAQSQARDAARAPAGVVWDPGAGVWVDLATGEVVDGLPAQVPPPLPHELVPAAARQDDPAPALDGALLVTAWTVNGAHQPLPDADRPLVLDCTRPDVRGQDVRVQLTVVPQVLALQRQAEQLAATFARFAAVGRPLQDLAEQVSTTGARLAAVGRPLQDLAEQVQQISGRVAQWQAQRDRGET